ncbi:MAG: DUF1622 domain-containing protein [Fibrobacter sp.]|jgi:uncharacterized membrane protein|nr:DUF1622 domain-containing protein [Fibrobacter sp.]
MINLEVLTRVAGIFLETSGILVILAATLYSFGFALYSLLERTNKSEVFRTLRQTLGSGILLGLEFLVAGDIIRTVAVEPTFGSVAVLGAIVLIRTFLSFTLQMEMSGRWPWQR